LMSVEEAKARLRAFAREHDAQRSALASPLTRTALATLAGLVATRLLGARRVGIVKGLFGLLVVARLLAPIFPVLLFSRGGRRFHPEATGADVPGVPLAPPLPAQAGQGGLAG
jgi:hypothetical protein